jgi:transposase
VKTSFHREYGRAFRGTKVEDTKRGKRSKRINVIAGLCNGEHLAVESYTHTTNSKFFEHWFGNCLLKEVPEGCTIIMDNATFHPKAKLRELADETGVKVLFLPTYSPDLNPIEVSWANMKRWLRDNSSRFWSVHFAIMDYFSISDRMIEQQFDGFIHLSDFIL